MYSRGRQQRLFSGVPAASWCCACWFAIGFECKHWISSSAAALRASASFQSTRLSCERACSHVAELSLFRRMQRSCPSCSNRAGRSIQLYLLRWVRSHVLRFHPTTLLAITKPKCCRTSHNCTSRSTYLVVPDLEQVHEGVHTLVVQPGHWVKALPDGSGSEMAVEAWLDLVSYSCEMGHTGNIGASKQAHGC